MENLPEYFAIKNSGFLVKDTYCVYQTSAYQSGLTYYRMTSVLWPVQDASLQTLTHFTHIPGNKEVLTRKWNSFIYTPSHWSHTGVEIEMTKPNGSQICIPVLKIPENILPYNNKRMVPTQSIQYTCLRRGIDIPAKLWTTDPAESLNDIPMVPIAPPVYPAPVYSPPVKSDSEKSLPPHVKKLLISEAIRNKEPCPISSEDITQTNASVTSCGHVFVSTEIKKWLSMAASKDLCPVCKQKCSL
jgi:hypothetical protein